MPENKIIQFNRGDIDKIKAEIKKGNSSTQITENTLTFSTDTPNIFLGTVQLTPGGGKYLSHHDISLDAAFGRYNMTSTVTGETPLLYVGNGTGTGGSQSNILFVTDKNVWIDGIGGFDGKNPSSTNHLKAIINGKQAAGNYALKEEIPSLSGYATQNWVQNTALSGYATQTWVTNQNYASKSSVTELQDEMTNKVDDILNSSGSPTDLYLRKYGGWQLFKPSDYTLKSDFNTLNSTVTNKCVTTDNKRGFATEAWVTNQKYASKSSVTELQNEMTNKVDDISNSGENQNALHLRRYGSWVKFNPTIYATQNWVQNSALSGYATQDWVQNSALSGYATQAWVTNQKYATQASLNGYATKTSVDNLDTLVAKKLDDAPKNTNTYGRKNGAWVVVPASSGGGVGKKGTGSNSEIFNVLTNNTAAGDASHAEGSNTSAGSHYSHTEGYNNKIEASASRAGSSCAHAEGDSNTIKSTGWAAHVEGNKNIAAGNSSHAGGVESEANGNYSFAHGYNVKAVTENEVAFGKYNYTDIGGSIKFSVGIGNGSDNSQRKNAFMVSDTGEMFLNGVGNYNGQAPFNGWSLQNIVEPEIVMNVVSNNNLRLNAWVYAQGGQLQPATSSVSLGSIKDKIVGYVTELNTSEVDPITRTTIRGTRVRLIGHLAFVPNGSSTNTQDCKWLKWGNDTTGIGFGQVSDEGQAGWHAGNFLCVRAYKTTEIGKTLCLFR